MQSHDRRAAGDREPVTRQVAEEIVQDAFVRGVDRGDDVRDSIVGWFYRVLRNAVIDHQRRQVVADRRLDQFAAELDARGEADEELARIVCGCVLKLADTLKPEYSDALRRIEVDQVAVKDYAATNGISASNAGVRIFRAREAPELTTTASPERAGR